MKNSQNTSSLTIPSWCLESDAAYVAEAFRKVNSTTAKAMNLTFSLLGIALAGQVPFGIPQ